MSKPWKNVELVQTCGACPEQYDVYIGSVEIGYLRLRHGYFRAEYKGTIVYDAEPKGDGSFYDDERKKHLNKARKAIYKAYIAESNGTPAMNVLYLKELEKISQIDQTQSSLSEQLDILRPFANKLGLYDAADYIKQE